MSVVVNTFMKGDQPRAARRVNRNRWTVYVKKAKQQVGKKLISGNNFTN